MKVDVVLANVVFVCYYASDILSFSQNGMDREEGFFSFARESRPFLLEVSPQKLGGKDDGEGEDYAEDDHPFVPMLGDLPGFASVFAPTGEGNALGGCEYGYGNENEVSYACHQQIAAGRGALGFLAKMEREGDTGGGDPREQEGEGGDGYEVDALRRVGEKGC